MTPEHWGMWASIMVVLGALVQVVRGVTKTQVTVERMSVDMTKNTDVTTQTQAKVSHIDSRVSRIEGRMGLGELKE